MTDHPILFSSPMVRALLDGSKTQTRRLVTKNTTTFDGGPWCNYVKYPDAFYFDQAWVDDSFPDPILKLPWDNLGTEMVARVRPRIRIGDELWVREAWRAKHTIDDVKPSLIANVSCLKYEADGFLSQPQAFYWNTDKQEKEPVIYGKLRPSIFMPRWASRITLTVTDVRVQRLREITGKDAWAEGVPTQSPDVNPLHEFETLWDSINSKRAPWKSNPWVVAYSFEVSK